MYRTGAIGPIRLSVRVYTRQTTTHDPDRSRRELYSIAGGSQAPNPNAESCLAWGRPIREPLSHPDLPIRNRRISRRGVINLEFNRQDAKNAKGEGINRQDAKDAKGEGINRQDAKDAKGEGINRQDAKNAKGEGINRQDAVGR